MLDDSYPDIKQMFEKVVDKCRDIQGNTLKTIGI